MSVRGDHFTGSTISMDLFDVIVGERLGGGLSREVFAFIGQDALVLKFETATARFQNVKEWDVWQRVEYVAWIRKWLAPCVNISPCGNVLVMKRTTPIPKNRLPKLVPAWCSDLKPENWGLYQGRPVIHDYGHHGMLEIGMSKRMVKAKW